MSANWGIPSGIIQLSGYMSAMSVDDDLDVGMALVSFEKRSVITMMNKLLCCVLGNGLRIFFATNSSGPDGGRS